MDKRENARLARLPDAPKRPVKFNFGGDGGPFDKVFDGFTDDTRWNGWLNVWVTTEEYRTKIRPMFVPTGNAEDFEDNSVEDIDTMATAADAAGELISLANCYTTLEVEPEA
jgi:hypothetical protein